MATPEKVGALEGRRPVLISGRTPRNRAVRSTGRLSRLRSLIWSARRKADLSITAMAREVKVGTSTIYGWEAGDRLPKGPQVQRLSCFMGLTPGALQCLIAAERADRLFRRGAATIEDLHRLVIAAIEESANFHGSAA